MKKKAYNQENSSKEIGLPKNDPTSLIHLHYTINGQAFNDMIEIDKMRHYPEVFQTGKFCLVCSKKTEPGKTIV